MIYIGFPQAFQVVWPTWIWAQPAVPGSTEIDLTEPGTWRCGRVLSVGFRSDVLDMWYCGWKKSCTTWDGRRPINNGINHLLTGAAFLSSTELKMVKIYVAEICWALFFCARWIQWIWDGLRFSMVFSMFFPCCFDWIWVFFPCFPPCFGVSRQTASGPTPGAKQQDLRLGFQSSLRGAAK